jgi:hypothetical protein
MSTAQLDLNHLSPIFSGHESSPTVFDQLVLPSGYREMILSLIAQHYRTKEASLTPDSAGLVDIVRGKGQYP